MCLVRIQYVFSSKRSQELSVNRLFEINFNFPHQFFKCSRSALYSTCVTARDVLIILIGNFSKCNQNQECAIPYQSHTNPIPSWHIFLLLGKINKVILSPVSQNLKGQVALGQITANNTIISRCLLKPTMLPLMVCTWRGSGGGAAVEQSHA